MDAGDGRELGQRDALEQPVVEVVGDLVEPRARLRPSGARPTVASNSSAAACSASGAAASVAAQLGGEPAAEPRQRSDVGAARRQPVDALEQLDDDRRGRRVRPKRSTCVIPAGV